MENKHTHKFIKTCSCGKNTMCACGEGSGCSPCDCEKSPCEGSGMEKKELRPCPFCGLMGIAICHESEFPWIKCTLCAGTITYEPLVDITSAWNSAWCWKEIDRLKEIIKKKDEALKWMEKGTWTYAGDRLGASWGELKVCDKAREALKLGEGE